MNEPGGGAGGWPWTDPQKQPRRDEGEGSWTKTTMEGAGGGV